MGGGGGSAIRGWRGEGGGGLAGYKEHLELMGQADGAGFPGGRGRGSR